MSSASGAASAPHAAVTPPSPSPHFPPLRTHTSEVVAAALDSAALHHARRLHGSNTIAVDGVKLRDLLQRTLATPTSLILCAVALWSALLHREPHLCLVAALLLGVKAAAVVVEGRQCRRAVSALQRCLPHRSCVAHRERTWVLLGSSQLVPGDVVRLAEGSTVHADCTLSSGSLLLRASALTGSVACVRAEPGQLLLAGCVVVDGSGTAVVRYTGHDTFAGQSVRLLSHLARGLARPVAQQAYVFACGTLLVVLVSAEICLFGFLRGWRRLCFAETAHEMVLFALLCLPLQLDLAVLLAVGVGAARAMERTQAVLLRLGALHALASVDVFIVNPCGAFTSHACSLADPFRSFSANYPTRASLVQLAVLATRWREATSHGFRQAVRRAADLDACDAYVLISSVDHSSEHRAASVVRRPDGTLLRVMEGEVTAVVRHIGATASTLLRVDALLQLVAMWAARGLHTRAVAVASEKGPWQLAGLLTFGAALRRDAADVVRRLRRLGVGVALASADGAGVVAAVQRSLGAEEAARAPQPAASVMVGGELPVLEAWQLLNTAALTAAATAAATLTAAAKGGGGSNTAAAASASVAADAAAALTYSAASTSAYARCDMYAEMQPESKATLVRLLQQCRLRVGVLGTSLSDAAAAHVADVGVALYTSEHGSLYPSQGALWGCDVALPSAKLIALCDLIEMSRGVFAAVHYLFFCTVTATCQTALLVAAVTLTGRVEVGCASTLLHASAAGLPPSELHVPLLLCVGGACLLVQTQQSGDTAYWAAAPCHHSYRVAALQSAAVALLGCAGGLALATLLCLFSRLVGGGAALTGEQYAGVVVLYLMYAQLHLSLVCASPVRCGLRLWRQRIAYVVTGYALIGTVAFLVLAVMPLLQVVLVVYCVGVAVLQDAAKLAVHVVCLRCRLFGYARVVNKRRRALSAQDRSDSGGDATADGGGGSGGGGEESDALLCEDQADSAQRARRPFSSVLDSVSGCLAALDVRLLQCVPPHVRPVSVDDE